LNLVITPDTSLSRRNIPDGISQTVALNILNAAENDTIAVPDSDGSVKLINLTAIKQLDAEMLSLLASSGKTALSEQFEADLEGAFYEALGSQTEVELNEEAITEYVRSMAGLE